ncbi:MAG: TrpR YerC/YecD [Lachnospiraceae bacterium]|nr:TrpR YerC/YecD [Lachnospiraceae bacterium]
MNSKLKSEEMDRLFQAILTLKNVDECYAFFEDICTIKELQALEQRFQVAGMLQQGCKYQAIVEKTGASTTTISRVNRALVYGNEGYHMAYRRLEEEEGD